MRKLSLLFISLFLYVTCDAQVVIAKLNFEDAELAFNNGQYQHSLEKLLQAEKIFGKVNLPILHLRVLNQDKILDTKMDFMLLFELKKNCDYFLKEYEKTEGVEDKYRQIYKISEKYSEYPSTKEEFELLKVKEQEKQQNDAALIKEVLSKNKRVTGEIQNGVNINSLYKKYKVENGYPGIKSTFEQTTFKSGHLIAIYNFGATLMLKINYNRTPDDYIYEYQKGKRKLTTEELIEYELSVQIFDYLDKPYITKEIKKASYKSKNGYLISYYIQGLSKREIFFEEDSGLELYNTIYYPDNKNIKTMIVYDSKKTVEGIIWTSDFTIYNYGNVNDPKSFTTTRFILTDLKVNIKFNEKDFR